MKYLGYIREQDIWVKFEADSPDQATPEASGYDAVIEDDE